MKRTNTLEAVSQPAYIECENYFQMDSQKLLQKNGFGVRTIVKALNRADYACIAGSSRPCSGAERLFSHALEYIAGQQLWITWRTCWFGISVIAQLRGLNWERIVKHGKCWCSNKGKRIKLNESSRIIDRY